MGSFVSILRFYSAHLASKAKFGKTMTKVLIIIFGFSFSYLPHPFLVNLSDFLRYKSLLEHCKESEKENLPSCPFFPLIGLSLFFGIIGTGFYFDLKMYFFVKKRQTQSTQGTQMIPWKSTGENCKDDLQVPIRATIITTISTLLMLSLIGLSLFFTHGNIESTSYSWLGTTLTISAACFPIVLMVYTVKRQSDQQSKINCTQPPQVLNFHESTESKSE